MKRLGGIAMLCALGLGVVSMASPASAGIDAQMRIYKKPSSPDRLSLKMNLAAGQKKTVYLRVLSGADKTFVLSGIANATVEAKWYTGFKNGSNITSTVRTDEGHSFTAKAEKVKKFRVKLKSPAAGAGCMVTFLRDGESPSVQVDVRVNTEFCTF